MFSLSRENWGGQQKGTLRRKPNIVGGEKSENMAAGTEGRDLSTPQRGEQEVPDGSCRKMGYRETARTGKKARHRDRGSRYALPRTRKKEESQKGEGRGKKKCGRAQRQVASEPESSGYVIVKNRATREGN